jgi:hypothetical protein
VIVTQGQHDAREEVTTLLRRELRQAIAELELCSHVSAVNPSPSGRDAGTDIGGNRPSGGVDGRDDRVHDHKLKSAEHFKRRVAKARAEQTLRAILKEAREALEAWRRQPPPKDVGHPMPGDHDWKRWVGESQLPAREIARKCSVSRAYVEKVRRQYADRMAA